MRGPWLAIDASTSVATVAVCRGADVLATRTTPARAGGADLVMPAVADALREAGIGPARLEAVVCGSGPGSFTGVRIAAAIAKGIAAGSGAPLYGVPSLLLLIAGVQQPLAPGRYLAVLDALRGEVYAAEVTIGIDGGYQMGSTQLLPTEALDTLRTNGATLVGPGQPLDVVPHARGAARVLALPYLREAVSLADWEPSYGRLAEAQTRWEAAQGRPLAAE